MKIDNFPPYKKANVDDLIPYANNSRTHNEDQVAQIAASIKEYGFTNPVLVDGSKGVIAGHGRLLAAKKLGLKQVPVIELGHLSETQKKAYIIADNKLALNADWNYDALKIEIEGLAEVDFDLGLTGFSGDELGDLFPEGKADGGADIGVAMEDGTEFLVVVDCVSEMEQSKLYDDLCAKGYSVKLVS